MRVRGRVTNTSLLAPLLVEVALRLLYEVRGRGRGRLRVRSEEGAPAWCTLAVRVGVGVRVRGRVTSLHDVLWPLGLGLGVGVGVGVGSLACMMYSGLSRCSAAITARCAW